MDSLFFFTDISSTAERETMVTVLYQLSVLLILISVVLAFLVYPSMPREVRPAPRKIPSLPRGMAGARLTLLDQIKARYPELFSFERGQTKNWASKEILGRQNFQTQNLKRFYDDGTFHGFGR